MSDRSGYRVIATYDDSDEAWAGYKRIVGTGAQSYRFEVLDANGEPLMTDAEFDERWDAA